MDNLILCTMDQPFYIISNASKDLFPENTLAEFKNVFPKTLTFKEEDKWEVGLEAIGLSSMFRNVYLPKSDVTSIYVLHEENARPSYKEYNVIDESLDWHKEMYFNFDRSTGRGTWFDIPNKYYNKAGVYALCQMINIRCKAFCLFSYDGERLSISYQDEYNLNNIGTWVFLHESFLRSFHFKRYKLSDAKVRPNSAEAGVTPNSNKVRIVYMGSNIHMERKVVYQGENYYGFYLSKNPKNPYHGPIQSEKFNIEKRQRVPDIIKVQCDIIEPQLLNNTYSQDLLVLSSDIHYTNRYFFYEIEKISYIPLLFNNISEIKIKLVDEKNRLIQLVTGHATIVKLRFKKNPNMEGNFYCRITSKPNKIYPDNKITNFSVQLPSTKELTDGWKVSMNSINLPNTFTTFLPNRSKNLLSFVYKTPNKPAISFTFKSNIQYTPARLISELNVFFMENNLGAVNVDELGRLVFSLSEDNVSFAIGLDVANVLGYENGLIISGSELMVIRPTVVQPKTITFESPIDCKYFRPNYFIVYSNIVQPSIIGGQYSPILKVVPILDSDEPYKLLDFKVREFYDISNSDINEIKVELRTHDGEPVNFIDTEHVVMNLQFTNNTVTA